MSNPNLQEFLRTPWTTDEVLGQYAYVLPAKHVISRDVDQEVVFYAIIGDQRDAVATATEAGEGESTVKYGIVGSAIPGRLLLSRACFRLAEQ